MPTIIRVARRGPSPAQQPDAAKSASLADIKNVSLTHSVTESAPLLADVLWGHLEIAEYMYGKAEATIAKGRTLVAGGVPVFKIGNRICARPSAIDQWIEDQERKRKPR